MKMMRMYQLDVDVNENDEVILSQDTRDAGPSSGVVIPFDQIESVCAVLTKAGEQIENRREIDIVNRDINKFRVGREAVRGDKSNRIRSGLGIIWRKFKQTVAVKAVVEYRSRGQVLGG